MQDYDYLIVPRGTSYAETEIKKSKFISRCFYVSTPQESKNIISGLRKTEKTAAHIVYAFICGPEKSCIMGMSDDREPKGTAGRPVLQVLKGSGISNILCTVTRFYGGIKLGTGGLVKAYTDSAQEALKNLETGKLVNECEIILTVKYEFHENVRHAIMSRTGFTITSEIFGTDIILRVKLPSEEKKSLSEQLSEITSGRIIIRDYF